jgi:hypothetical protein
LGLHVLECWLELLLLLLLLLLLSILMFQ